MALDLKRINKNKEKNEADKLIEEMTKKPASASAALTEELKNMAAEPAKAAETPAPVDVTKTVEAPAEVLAEDKKAEKPAKPKKEKKDAANKGRRTKAEMGEVCRVQFSTTLEPDMLDAMRKQSKKEHMPFSCVVERAFMEYLTNH